MTFPYTINTRYTYQSTPTSLPEPLTLLYIGQLPSTNQATTWLGVEWDAGASRGKHSGNHLGVDYFKTRVGGAGSFIKYSENERKGVLKEGPGFWEVLRERYVDKEEGEEEEVTLRSTTGDVVVEAPNMRKVKDRLGDLKSLRSVGLEKQWISGLGEEAMRPEGGLPNLQSLNLSQNLLSSWSDLFSILDQLPSLVSLSINQSRLPPITTTTIPQLNKVYEGITELHLRESLLTWEEILLLSPAFPSLQSLFVGGNSLTLSKSISTSSTSSFINMKELLVDDCQISSWEEVVACFGHLKSLQTLNLSFNPLTIIPPPTEPITTQFPTLHTLIFLSGNLSSWSDIDNLALHLPGLTTLKISSSSTSIATLDLSDNKARPFLIAKLPRLEVLNSTEISKEERDDAERYYVGQGVASGVIDGWGRLKELSEKHGIAATSSQQVVELPSKVVMKSRMINLHFRAPTSSDLQTLSLLPKSSLKLLRQKICRLIGLPITTSLEITILRITLGGEDNEGIVVDMSDESETVDWSGLSDGNVVMVKEV